MPKLGVARDSHLPILLLVYVATSDTLIMNKKIPIYFKKEVQLYKQIKHRRFTAAHMVTRERKVNNTLENTETNANKCRYKEKNTVYKVT